jgi:eukaryotic-like serine/threonine-protein kinase
MINRERWQQLSALLDEALALEAAARPVWLAALRQRDAALADELSPMLAQADTSTDSQHTRVGGMAAFDGWLAAALQTPAKAIPQVQVGQRWGAWQLLRKIGEGGMGQVWLAQRADGLYAAQAAIKLLRHDMATAGLADRFARERVVLARLNHAAVARLLDAGEHDGQAYLVLEFVDGLLLGEYMRSKDQRSSGSGVQARVQLLLRIAQAVDHAHAQLIVHRDLKPNNVIVTANGEPKLLDFGIAALLDDGELQTSELTRQTGRGLTLGYAAPEQILGTAMGTAADVFSLGVMLFELLSGELPFASRQASRLATEHAVLHDEPKSLRTLLQRPATDEVSAAGPGRPSDPAQVSLDLEAIVNKALRKDPAQRYGSVRALMDDLQAWQTHRPAEARRDDWRHRTHLWLRRHGVLASALALVVMSLGVGLAAATWQWQRAKVAARQSDQIANYLTELLASASPEAHGGKVPTVLQLLETSRAELADKFRDDTDTRIRLLNVLANTYHELGRYDNALPLYDELALLSRARYGADDTRTLQAQWERGRAYQIQGQFDKTIESLEPLLPRAGALFGHDEAKLRMFLYLLSTSYVRAGRMAEADPLLARAGELTQARFAPGTLDWMSHQNHLMVLRSSQGRLREALQAIMKTQPYWGDTRVELARQLLVYRRNAITIQIRLADYDGVETRARAVIADLDRLLGAGNEVASGMRHELARYFTESGQPRRALEERLGILKNAQDARVLNPAVLVPMQVQVLLARAQAHAAPADDLRQDTQALLADVRAHTGALGYARAEAWLNLARVGLLLDDAALAAEALAPLKADAGLRLDKDILLASRVAGVEGALARLSGDLPRSRTLLQQRMAIFERPGDQQLWPAWVAALDLAWTLVLMHDAQAPSALQAAAARRPPGIAAGHPLDLVQAYLQAYPQGDSQVSASVPGRGSTDPGATATARRIVQDLRQLQGRRPDAPPGPGIASFAGALH